MKSTGVQLPPDTPCRLPPLRPALGVLLVLPWLVWASLAQARWSSDPEFYYGWAVVPLAGYLFALRWEEYRAPQDGGSNERGKRGGWSGLALAGAVILGGAMLVLEPNPVWTTWLWIAGAGAAITTLAAIGALTKAQAVRWFLFPVAFALTALPWPAVFQVPLLTALKTVNARIAAEAVSALGHPAIASGSIIEVGRGIVGVEDACSGLRALQAVTMIALFFGEIARFSLARRLVLLASGVLLALLANAGRTVFLTWQMARSGATSVEAWHDQAGMMELVVAFAGVVVLGRILEARGPAAHRVAASRGPILTSAAPTGVLGLTCSLAAIYAGAWGFTRYWYRESGDAQGARVAWRLVPPPAGWHSYPLDPRARALLQNDSEEGLATDRGGKGGRDWIVLHLAWDRDPALRYLASLHSPEVCLPNIGARLDGVLGLQQIEAAGIGFTLQGLRFNAQGRSLHVFHGLWDATRGRALTPEENSAMDFDAERWRLVKERRRTLALSQLTIAVQGCSSDAEAIALLRAELPRLVVAGGRP